PPGGRSRSGRTSGRRKAAPPGSAGRVQGSEACNANGCQSGPRGHPVASPASMEMVNRRTRSGQMIAVSVTFHYGQDFSAAKLRQLAENSKSKFEHMPGLHSKLFSVFPQLRKGRNL